MTVGVCHSKLIEIRKLDSLTKDIITYQLKGLGEGADIPNLQFTVNIVTYSSGRVGSGTRHAVSSSS